MIAVTLNNSIIANICSLQPKGQQYIQINTELNTC